MAEQIASDKKGKRGALKKMPVRIDFTAIVDLAFLLITFFILTTSLAKPKAMEIAMPVAGGPPVGWAASHTMSICLGKNNKVLWYLGMPDHPLMQPKIVNYSKTGLREAIINTGKSILKSSGRPMIVILKPSAHSLYDNLVTAIDELNIGNVPSYAIADITPKDIELLKQKDAY